MKKFLWDITHTKCIKTKEIREHNVRRNEEFQCYEVVVFGFFGGGVTIFAHPDEMECRKFVDEMTQ